MVANIEVRPNPRRVDGIEIRREFFRGLIVGSIVVVQETVPHIFNQNMDAKVRGQRQSLPDLSDGSFPSGFFGDRVPANRRNQENRGSAIRMRIANGGLECFPPLFTLGGVRIGQRDLPVDRINHARNTNPHLLGSGNHLEGRHAVG